MKKISNQKSKTICSKCHEVVDTEDGECPRCNAKMPITYNYKNSDDYLKREIPLILEKRKNSGLEGLVGGLDCLIVNTEPENLVSAVQEILNTTGYILTDSFTDEIHRTFVLQGTPPEKPKLILRSRKSPENPFLAFNLTKKARGQSNTRIETFCFTTPDIEKYVSIQKERGINFMTPKIQHYENYSFIQTVPSHYIGSAIGFIEWHNNQNRRNYSHKGSEDLKHNLKKPKDPWLDNIRYIDHTATRVRARDRDAAVIEFMELTNYKFEKAIYAKELNSITSVTRLGEEEFAMVFTSGITPFIGSEDIGPTEKYTFNYGTRVHHIAYQTKNIENTYKKILNRGQDFLVELVGGPDDGLHQCFTVQSPHTMLVNEYIHRYGDFDGFFTKSNVRDLTKGTEKQ